MIKDVLDIIYEYGNRNAPIDFERVSRDIIQCVDRDSDFLSTLIQIGTIPEAIEHDSTEEKLFSKASDAVLSRAFREIGLKSTVLSERGDSADVFAESPIHGYSLVADSKAFRLSRTAKNQKDYKVSALSSWKRDNDFAVLCAPYFHYPSMKSQIYAQALENNVCLLSWEHFVFFIRNGISENSQFSFAPIWNCSKTLAKETVVDDNKRCIIPRVNEVVISCTGYAEEDFNSVLAMQRKALYVRSHTEIQFWKREVEKIQQYTREQAIRELIHYRKIDERIRQINSFRGSNNERRDSSWRFNRTHQGYRGPVSSCHNIRYSLWHQLRRLGCASQQHQFRSGRHIKGAIGRGLIVQAAGQAVEWLERSGQKDSP